MSNSVFASLSLESSSLRTNYELVIFLILSQQLLSISVATTFVTTWQDTYTFSLFPKHEYTLNAI